MPHENALKSADFNNTYFCSHCGAFFSDTYDCAVEMDCEDCGTRHLSPFSTVDEGDMPTGTITIDTACTIAPNHEHFLSRIQASIGDNEIFIFANKNLIAKMPPDEARICDQATSDLPNCLKGIHQSDVESVAAHIAKILQPITNGENDLVTTRMHRLLALPQTDRKITLANLANIANDQPLTDKPKRSYSICSTPVSNELLKNYTEATTFFKVGHLSRDKKAGEIALYAQIIPHFSNPSPLFTFDNPFEGVLSQSGFELLVHIASQTPNTPYEKARAHTAQSILHTYDKLWPTGWEPFQYSDKHRAGLLENLSAGLVTSTQVSPYLLTTTIWRAAKTNPATGLTEISFYFEKPTQTDPHTALSSHTIRDIIS